MKAHIEKVFVIAGNAHCYQYIIVVISMLIWGFTTIFSSSLAFLEAQPTVILFPKDIAKKYNTTLNYTICDTVIDKEILKDKINISWTNDLGIECEKLKTSLIGTITSFGYLMGAALSSIVNYYLGERKALLGAMTLFILIMLGATFVKNYYYYCFTTFTTCFCSNIAAYTGMVLLNEIIDQKKKALLSIFIYCGMGIGGISFFGLFYFLDNWKHVFYFTVSVVVVIEVLIAFILIDSPLKAVNNNDFVTFISLMRFVARINKKLEIFDLEVGTETYLKSFKRLFGNENANEYSVVIQSFVRTTVPFNALNESLIQHESRNFLENKQHQMASIRRESKPEIKKESIVICLFKYKSVRTPFLMFCFFWFSTSCLFSGLSISLKFLEGDIILNGIYLYSVEIIGYIVSGFLINTQTFGRKGSMMLFSGGIAISLALYIICFNYSPFSLVFYILTRFFVMSAFCIYYTFALESYPNSIKTTAYALNGSCNSLGGMVVPFLVEYIDRYVLFIAFSVLFGIITGLMYFLKETRGKTPRDDIIEIETNFSEKNPQQIDLRNNLSEITEINVE